MMNLLVELKRRQMFRVAAAYAVVAWVLLQVVNNVAPALRLPDWAPTLVLVLLIVGFPVALLFCWIQQLGSLDGAAKAGIGRMDWALVGALIVVIGLLSYQQFVPSGAALPQEQQAGVIAARSASLSPAGVSVAVLPFANVSADPEQEFFSDGITDEISGALAKIPDLRVVGRTSAFQYKTRNTDLRSIGQALSATHLIEGSVRRAGDRVRITVQLSLAENGLQVWSENYDREFTDIFAIQEDIARAIASSLNMQLGLRPGENLVNNRNIDAETYQLFLRARTAFRGRGTGVTAPVAIPDLVKRDPEFAPAWGLLAQTHITLQPLDTPLMARSAAESRPLIQARIAEAEKAAREAIRLDPQLASGHAVLAAAEAAKRNWAAADELYRKALTLDPYDPDTLSTYGTLLATIGRLKESLRFREQAHQLEPFLPDYMNFLGNALIISGQNEAAISVLESHRGQIGFRNEVLARAYAAVGRHADAIQTMQAIGKNRYGDSGESIEAAVQLLRVASEKTNPPVPLPVVAGRLNFVYAYVGASERMLEYPERALEAGMGISQGIRNFWDPLNAPLRKTERFKAHMRKAGLVDYWRERGWPDLCKPVGTNDFACE